MDKKTFRIIEGYSQGIKMIGSFIANYKPDTNIPWCLWIKVPVRFENGVISKQEAESLDQFEDQLNNHLDVVKKQFVGRLTFNGYREIYYYISDPDVVNKTLEAKSGIRDLRKIEYEIKHDPKWSILQSYTKSFSKE